MAIVKHRVGIRGSIEDIYRALTESAGLTGWWATTASGSSEVGQTLTLGFGGVVSLAFVVQDMNPPTQLTLTCPEGPGPWQASTLIFTLTPEADQVFVTLTHASDTASDDDFLYFNTKWPIYLLSLRDFIETGTGRPSPTDIPIFHGDNVTSNTENN